MQRQDSWFERTMFRRSLAQWASAADGAPETDLPRLKQLRKRAWTLRTHLDRLIAHTETRLRPAPAIARPMGTDWIWRPGIFTEVQRTGFASADRSMICRDATLFHDCALNEIGVQQVRNTDASSETPYALQIDVFEFRGSFLSLAIDMPDDAVNSLRRKHLVSVRLRMDTERDLRVFARLNVRHGPNTEQLLVEVGEDRAVEFDLAYSDLNEARAEKMWLDLMFDGPRMNRIVLRDLTMSRRPRAEL